MINPSTNPPGDHATWLPGARLAAFLALTLSIAGLANQWMLLQGFGISLSDYADLDDFLVAAINLLSWKSLVVYLPLSLVFGILVFTLAGLGRHRWLYAHIWSVVFLFLVTVGGGVGWLAAREIKAGKACEMSVQLKLPGPAFSRAFASNDKEANVYRVSEPETTPFDSDEGRGEDESKLYLITGINAATFFYETNGEAKSSVHAAPTSAIAQITYVACAE